MNQTEREVPAEIEEAIKNYGFKCSMSGWYSGEQHKIAAKEAQDVLRQAILAALESERELRAKNEHLDRLWRFVWFERECVRNQAFDLWGEALDEIHTELDALGAPPPLPHDADDEPVVLGKLIQPVRHVEPFLDPDDFADVRTYEALRARCERLRKELVISGANIEPACGQPPVFRRFIHPGDLADDLVTRPNKDDAS